MANSIGSNGNFLSGAQTVTTAGTEVRLLPTSTAQKRWRSVTIIAKAENTGKIYLGGSDVASTTNGGLAAGDSVSLAYDHVSGRLLDLDDIWIDASVNGEGVDFYAIL